MSHELRTPLNSIIGYSQVLQQETFGPLGNNKYREYVDVINISGNHLHDVIGNILDISKIDAGEMTLDESEIAVEGFVGECLQIVREHADREGIRLGANVDPKLVMFRGDALRLKQVVLNLLSNAINFTPRHGTVTVDAGVDDAGAMTLAVTDTGTGIAADDIPTVLEPFGQVRDGYERTHRGTGLGLPLSKSLVELHDGEIDIESEVGEGTRVVITFPAERTIRPS